MLCWHARSGCVLTLVTTQGDMHYQYVSTQPTENSYHRPYFTVDKQVEKNMLAKLKEDYNQTLKHSLPNTEYIRHIERTLKFIYEKGILSVDDYQLVTEDSIQNIMLVDKNMATLQETE